MSPEALVYALVSALVQPVAEADHDAVAKRCFELSTTVPGAPVAVIDFLVDLEHHRGLHPFLISARPIGTGTSRRGSWCDWDVEERPRFGPLSYRMRFRARVTRLSATAFETWVHPLPNCHLRGRTRAEETTGGRTRVTESVTAVAPFLMVSYLARQARAAHRQTYERLFVALADAENRGVAP